MQMQYTDTLPDPTIPPLRCDFNACGWSGEPDDNCYYSLYRDELARLNPPSGKQVYIYDDDISDEGQPEVFGCTATIEHVHLRGRPYVRARPTTGPWYRGPKPAYWKHGT
jgi:hypothetical protein